MKKLLLIQFLVLLIFTVWLTGPLPVAADWPTLLGDAAHTQTPVSNPPLNLKYQWNTALRTSILASPVTDAARLFIGDMTGRFLALDKTTGAILWTFRLAAPIRSTACVDGDRVYVVGINGRLYCLRTSDGRILFAYDTDASVYSSPVVSGANLYLVASSEQTLLCLDKLTGSLLWSATLTQPSLSTPLIVGNRVLLAANDGDLYCFSTTDGSPIYRFETSGNAGFHLPVSLADGSILYSPGILDRNLYCIDPLTGNELWRYTGGPTGAAPLRTPGRRLSPTSLRRVKNVEAMLDGTSPMVAGRAPGRTPSLYLAPVDPNLVNVSMAATADATRAYFIVGYPEATLVAVDRTTRSMVWNYPLYDYPDGVGYYPPPLAAGGYIYLFDRLGNLQILDANDGSLVSGIATDDTSYSAVAWDNGAIYGVSKSGNLFCLVAAPDPTAPDALAPVISQLTPAAGSVITLNPPRISARVIDDISGVNMSALVLKIDGTTIPVSWNSISSTAFRETGLPYSEGLHTVFLQVSDHAGNTDSATWSFTINSVADTTPPVLSFVSPGDGVTLPYNRYPEILVHLSDGNGSGVSPFKIDLYLDDKLVPYLFDNANQNIQYTPTTSLNAGVHTVKARAADLAGNISDFSNWTFTIGASTDSAPPQGTGFQPTDGSQITDTRQPAISATVQDAVSGVKSSTVTLFLDDVMVDHQYDPASGIVSYIPATPLVDGNHVLRLYAEDQAGFSATFTWSFTMNFTIAVLTPRITDIGADLATVCWMTLPAATGVAAYSTFQGMAGSVTLDDARGAGQARLTHRVNLTGLTPETDYYVVVSGSGSGTAYQDNRVLQFRTMAAGSGSGGNLSGVLRKSGTPVSDGLIFLTVRSGTVLSMPLSAHAGADGSFSIPLAQLRSRDGSVWSLAANQILQVSASDGSGAAGLQNLTLADPQAGLNMGDFDLQASISYRHSMAAGLNPLALAVLPTGVDSSFDLLASQPDLQEINTYDSTGQRFLSAARLFGSPAGDDFPLGNSTALFLKVANPLNLNLTGIPLELPKTLALRNGLNLIRLPGADELPDNPLAPQRSLAWLTANPALTTLAGFDPQRQFYDSTFYLGGSVHGDDFPLYYDRAYFGACAADVTLNPTLLRFSPDPTAPAAPALAAPNRGAARSAETSGLLLPPYILCGRLLSPAGDPQPVCSLQVAVAGSAPRLLTTDSDGVYHLNLANLTGVDPAVNLSVLPVTLTMNGEVHVLTVRGEPLMVLDDLIIEGGRE